jgi:hypothetical protein
MDPEASKDCDKEARAMGLPLVMDSVKPLMRSPRAEALLAKV